MRRFLRAAAAVPAALALVLAGGAAASAVTAPAQPSAVKTALVAPAHANSAAFQDEVLRLVNVLRADAGLNPLYLYPGASASAQAWAETMADGGAFEHQTSAALQAATGAGWVGENIAAGRATPADVVQQWWDSPGHRANMLRPEFTFIGIGYEYNASSTYRHYWCQVFGGSTTDTPVVGSPTISGNPYAGEVLTASPGDWSPGQAYFYQWRVDGVDVAGETGTTYTTRVADEGKAVTVRVWGAQHPYRAVAADSNVITVLAAVGPTLSGATDLTTTAGVPASVPLTESTAVPDATFSLENAPAGVTLTTAPDGSPVLNVSSTAAIEGTLVTVVATNAQGTARHDVTVTVSPGPVAAISIGNDPATPVALGATVPVTVVEQDQYGNVIGEGTGYTVTTDDATATVSGQDVVFGSLGAAQVIATKGALTASVTLTVEGEVAPTLTDPGAVTTQAGTAATVTVAETTAQPAATFALENAPAGVSIDPATGLLTVDSTVAGATTVTVVATNSAGEARVDVLVTVEPGPVAAIAIGNDPATPVDIQVTVPVTVVEQDQYGNVIGEGTGYTVTVTDPLATVAGQDVTFGTPGTWTVTAMDGTRSASADLVAVGGTAPTLGDPGTVSTTAGVPVTVPVPETTATPAAVFALENAPAGVSIDPATGLLTVDTTVAATSTVVVVATNAVGVHRLEVAVTVTPGPVAGITLANDPAAPVRTGSTVPVTVLEHDQYGNLIGEGTGYTVTTADVAATVTGHEVVFGTEGTWTVTATDGTLTATVDLLAQAVPVLVPEPDPTPTDPATPSTSDTQAGTTTSTGSTTSTGGAKTTGATTALAATGVSAGVGAALVIALLAVGAFLVVGDRRAAALDRG